jgi:hypothetical protein
MMRKCKAKGIEIVSECRTGFETCLNNSRAALQAPQRRLPDLNDSLVFPV